MRTLWVSLLLALLLVACEGTKEPELPLVLAAGGEEGVRFFLTDALRQGEAAPLGEWRLPGVRDLAARDDGLWLLTENELRRYGLSAFTAEAAPPEAEAREGRWALPAACPEGRLFAGGEDLLVVCAADRVYRLRPGEELQTLDTAEFDAFPEVRYGLYPDPESGEDLLAVVYARAEGWHFALFRGDEATFQKDLEAPANPLGFDLYRTPEEPPRLLILARGEPSRLFAYRDGLKELAASEGEADPVRVTGDQGTAAAFGQGLWLVQDEKRYETGYPDFRAGWVSPDLYLYLATEDRLLVYDVAGLPPTRLKTLGLAGIRALAGFALR